jgi:hypothetical protein
MEILFTVFVKKQCRSKTGRVRTRYKYYRHCGKQAESPTRPGWLREEMRRQASIAVEKY